MNIAPIQIHNTNFKGLHVDAKTLKGLGCSSRGELLTYPFIGECARNYDVLVKKIRVPLKDHIPMNEHKFKTFLAGAGGTSVAYLLGSIWGNLGVSSLFLGSGVGMLLYGIKAWLNAYINGYDYVIQGGKNPILNKSGEMEFEGVSTDKYIISSESDIDTINPDFCNQIIARDKERFMRIMQKYPISQVYEPQDMLNILNDEEIRKYFFNGDCFNYKIDDNSLLLAFMDMVPTSENKSEYDEVINIMKKMYTIDYNQVDKNGISVVEKVLNSENNQTLELLRGHKFNYDKSLDDVYKNIKNYEFRAKAARLMFLFPNIFKALDMESEEAFKIAIKDIESPLCNSNVLKNELVNYVYENCSKKFISEVFFPNLNAHL